MNNECFVPKCKNTVGAPFPRDAESKQKWLEGLQLTHVAPKAGSFVCFAHFNLSDLNEENVSGGTRPSNRLKRGAVPCILNPVKIEGANPTKSEEKTEELKRSPRIHKKSESSQDEEVKKASEVEKICRACMTEKNLEAEMFDFIEDDVTISAAFMMCVFPVEVSEQDSLPKQICKSCLSTLKVAYKFRKNCVHTDDILRARCTVSSRKRKISDGGSERSVKKTRQADPDNKESKEFVVEKDLKTEEQPCKLADIGSSDVFEFIDECERSIQDQENADEEESEAEDGKNKIKSEEQINKESDSEMNSPTRRSRRLADKENADENSKGKSLKSRKVKSQVDIDEIEKNLEEIHGQNSKGVEVEEPVAETPAEINRASSPETEEGTTVEDILNTLEEGNIDDDQEVEDEHQDVLDEFLKTSSSSSKISLPQIKKKIVVKSNFPVKIKKESGILSSIKLPKDVKIRPVEKFLSDTGKFIGTLKSGVFESIFVQADDYLFELGLVKGTVRHLRCSVPSCPAHGKQKVLENGEFDNVVDVVIPHDHRAPNEAVKKKQMFLCVMRKKMQTDKTLNIRVIYEGACTEDPDIAKLVPLRNVINEICRHQLTHKLKPINTFEDFYSAVDTDPLEKLQFTHNNQQFYQEKFSVEEDGSKAILFGNTDVIQQVSASKIMYVDASFKIDTHEDFKYQLVTVLVWIEDSYYPILFALVNKKSQLIFRQVFAYLRDELAPDLRPQEIITDYEANLYYALAEVFIDSNIGGSVFYYTQNLYKKICSLNLSRDLETNSYFRNIYHMLLMLPLLPVNTILDGLNNIQLEARNLHIFTLAQPLFDHIRTQWILNVTPELFCVHKLENRINENVIAPFKKLRDFLLLTKGKLQKTNVTIVHVIEKIIELEAFLRGTYSKPDKKSFGRDLSSFQKKNVLRAWQFIEDHPKIEINNFFSKVLGYIKCMENQLWIWGFYRYDGDTDDILINAAHFSIVSPNEELMDDMDDGGQEEEYLEYVETPENTIVMEAVIDQDGVLQTGDEILTTEGVVATTVPQQFVTEYVKYIHK